MNLTVERDFLLRSALRHVSDSPNIWDKSIRLRSNASFAAHIVEMMRIECPDIKQAADDLKEKAEQIRIMCEKIEEIEDEANKVRKEMCKIIDSLNRV